MDHVNEEVLNKFCQSFNLKQLVREAIETGKPEMMIVSNTAENPTSGALVLVAPVVALPYVRAMMNCLCGSPLYSKTIPLRKKPEDQ